MGAGPAVTADSVGKYGKAHWSAGLGKGGKIVFLEFSLVTHLSARLRIF